MNKIVASVSALAVLVGATVACSSAPNDPPPLQSFGPSASATTTSTSRAPAPSNSNSNNSNGTSNPTPTPTPSTDTPDSGTPGTPTPAMCSSQTTFDACYDCCVPDATTMSAGEAVFQQCACAPSACRTQCLSTYCSNQAPSAQCEQCLQNQSACQQQADTACAADSKCNAAMTCLDTSGCDSKP